MAGSGGTGGEKTGAQLEGASLGQVRAGAWGGGEGLVRMGGFGTFWQVELHDRNSVKAWTATVAAGRARGEAWHGSCPVRR